MLVCRQTIIEISLGYLKLWTTNLKNNKVSPKIITMSQMKGITMLIKSAKVSRAVLQKLNITKIIEATKRKIK